jgi:hypothetical protein
VVVDANGNGVLDPGETAGVAGATVTAGSFSDVTNSDGNFTITGVTPGTYDVCQTPPVGWTQSVPAGCHENVAVSSGQDVSGLAFGDFQQGSISGTRLINGEGFPGQTVRLLDGGGTEVGTTTTNEDNPATTEVDEAGTYEFTGLNPGDYTVCTGNVGDTTGTPGAPCETDEVGIGTSVASGLGTDVDFNASIEGEPEVLACGMTTELGGEGGVTGSVLLADCEGAKVVDFQTDPGLDEAVNEVSFDTVGETEVEGGYTIEEWFFPFVPVPPGDTFLYYDDGDGVFIAPFCLTDPSEAEGYPDALDPTDFLPLDPEHPLGQHTTCIFEDVRRPVGVVGEPPVQFAEAEIKLLSIGDPGRGFR